jgi:hypothetical protein
MTIPDLILISMDKYITCPLIMYLPLYIFHQIKNKWKLFKELIKSAKLKTLWVTYCFQKKITKIYKVNFCMKEKISKKKLIKIQILRNKLFFRIKKYLIKLKIRNKNKIKLIKRLSNMSIGIFSKRSTKCPKMEI